MDSTAFPPPEILTECIDLPEDEVASFPGGKSAWNNWLAANMTYPEVALEQGDHGRVYVSFVIEIDGSITHVELLRGVSPELDREALRLVKSMPKWNPSSMDGRLIRSRCRAPIIFTLQ